jgi:hypothetical protein
LQFVKFASSIKGIRGLLYEIIPEVPPVSLLSARA